MGKSSYGNTVKSRKQAGNYYKPVSSISRYFLKKRYPALLYGLNYKPEKFLKVFSISSACFCDFMVYYTHKSTTSVEKLDRTYSTSQ